MSSLAWRRWSISRITHHRFVDRLGLNGNVLLPLEEPSKGTLIYNQNVGNRLGVFLNGGYSMYFVVVASDNPTLPIPFSLFNAAHYHASRSVTAD